MPEFTIIEIRPVEKHTFLIITSSDNEYDILVGLSWGNGGAGCNNPRAMFSLENKKGGGMGGGGFEEEGLEPDDPEIQEEKYIFDRENTVAILESKPQIKDYITKKLNEIAKLKGQHPGMILKSGLIKINNCLEYLSGQDMFFQKVANKTVTLTKKHASSNSEKNDGCCCCNWYSKFYVI